MPGANQSCLISPRNRLSWRPLRREAPGGRCRVGLPPEANNIGLVGKLILCSAKE